MKLKIVYIERKSSYAVSIEKVFRQIEKSISKTNYESEFQQLPYFNQALGILKNFIYFKKKTADIYHITGDVHYIALLLPSKKTVLTIHDLRFLHRKKGFRRFIIKKLFLDLPIRRLKYITAISEATRNEILENTNCPAEKIRLIENPLREDFSTAIDKNFNEKCPNILQIGTAPNKNVVNLIKALKDINCRVIIIGEIDRELMSEIKVNKTNFVQKVNLKDEELKDEYMKADIVAFCSLYEGFGLPIIEAQAMRTAVITSDIAPLNVISGGGAVLVNPNNINEIREGVLKIISDKKYRENLIEKGLENIKNFAPEKIAGLYENLYQEIFTNSII